MVRLRRNVYIDVAGLPTEKLLIRYPEGGRLRLSNNRAEHSIKPFVMGRTN